MMSTVIGRYEVVRRLGQGGMAALYLARDPVIDRMVALKLLREGFDTQELRERFAREARSAGRLRHPNIVTIFDVGEHDGQPFIAMEYIPGETLAEMIRRSAPLSLNRKLELVEDLCAGLGYAHAAGIVHRDVKPANIMVDPEGILKILDFGIARVGDSSMTQAGMIVGTLNYMSPEQVAGGTIDHRSDIFAVGAVSYELLSGRQAFPGNLQSGILHRILQVDPDPLARLIPQIDPTLTRIVSTALQKEPARRYQDLGTMRKDIAQARQLLAKTGGALLYDGETIELSPETPAPVAPRHRAELEALRSRRASEVEKHLEQARRALDAQEYQGAVAACESTLLLDPEEPRAIELLDRARASIAHAQVHELLDRAQAELNKGDLTAASRLVQEAAGLDPLSEQAAALSRAIDTARLARERAAMADRIAAQARSRLDEQAPDSAIRLAQEVLGIEPAHSGAREVIQRAQALIDARRRDEHDRRAREAIRDARAQFDAGEQNAALESLRAFAPPHPLVTDTVTRLQAEAEEIARRLRQEAEARQRAETERLAREAIAKARAQFDAGERNAALESLRAFDPPHPLVTDTVTRLQAEAEEIARRLRQEAEARQRAEAERVAREAIAKARAQFDAGERDAALESLRAFDPPHPLVTDAVTRLQAEAEEIARRLRQEAEARQRAEAERLAREAIERARARFDAGERDAAVAALRAFQPAHPLVTAAVAKLQAEAEAIARRLREEEEARRRAEAARLAREQRIAAAVREAREAIDRQQYDDAIRVLEQAQRVDGGNTTLAALRDEAVAARRAVQEALELRRRVEAAVREASRLFEAGNLDGARRPLDEAFHLAPDDEAARDLKRRLDEATEAQARRKREMAALMADASRLEAANDLAGAIARADAALALDPRNATALELRRRVTRSMGEAEERQRKVGERIARARATSAHPKAIALLRGVLEMDPGNEQATTLLHEREAALAAARAEKDRRTPQRPHVRRRPTLVRVAAGLALLAFFGAGGIYLAVRSRQPMPPATVRSASTPTQPPPANEVGRPEAATPPSPGTSEPTTGATQAAIQAPELGREAATPGADKELEELRRQAALQLKRGDRGPALATVLAALQFRPDDQRLRSLLQDVVRDTRQEASRARDDAQQVGAASQSAFAGATRDMERAAAEERSGRLESAGRLFLTASAQFADAANAARQAAAARPAAESQSHQAAPQSGAQTVGGGTGQPPAGQPAHPVSPQPPAQLPAVAPPTAPPPPTSIAAAPPAEPSQPPARSSTAQPPAAAAGSQAADEAAIQQTLAAYKSAYEHLDASAVRSVQPSLTVPQTAMLEKTFADYRSYSVQIDDVKIAVNGSQAIVSCQITRRYDPKAGRPGGNTVPTVLHLEKRGPSWVISRVETR